MEWPGTLLLVSHDRRFLDNVVTSTLAFEGDGKVQEYVGGYDDWLRQSKLPAPSPKPSTSAKASASAKASTSAPQAASRKSQAASRQKNKRTFKEEKEYAGLPKRIVALEEEQAQLQATMARPEFYTERADAIKKTMARVETIERELLTVMARWDELDSVGKSG